MKMIVIQSSSVLLLLFISLIVEAVPPHPTWPEEYKVRNYWLFKTDQTAVPQTIQFWKSCMNVMTGKKTIRAGWYVDTENRKMRLDSYSIPQGFNDSTVEVYQYLLEELEHYEYACSQFGPPLLVFLYHYDRNQMMSLFPGSSPPYRTCSVDTIYNKFPNSPLLPDIEFVEEGKDNITMYDHWRSEFFLYTMDYLFHTANGVPYKLIVNGEENVFLSFEEGRLAKDTFFPPAGVVCT